MFGLISGNWAGEPLTRYEAVLKHIRATRSSAGFRRRARLDRRQHEAHHRVLPEERAGGRLQRRKVLPQWNYTIKPHAHPQKGQVIVKQRGLAYVPVPMVVGPRYHHAGPSVLPLNLEIPWLLMLRPIRSPAHRTSPRVPGILTSSFS
jgi:hypothetical protein